MIYVFFFNAISLLSCMIPFRFEFPVHLDKRFLSILFFSSTVFPLTVQLYWDGCQCRHASPSEMAVARGKKSMKGDLVFQTRSR